MDSILPLRISLITAGHSQSSVENRLADMLRALRKMGAEVQVLALSEGESREANFCISGIQPILIPYADHPAVRLAKITLAATHFQPHFLQATHFFPSFYAALAGRLVKVPSIGAISGDFQRELADAGRWCPWLIRLPSALLLDNCKARQNALAMGLPSDRLYLLRKVENDLHFAQFESNLVQVYQEIARFLRVQSVLSIFEISG